MKKRYRRRRVSWCSHRQLRQVLLAFALTAAVLGAGLCIVFGYRQQYHLMGIGALYLLGAGLLFGIRGVLAHLDELHRHRRENRAMANIEELS